MKGKREKSITTSSDLVIYRIINFFFNFLVLLNEILLLNTGNNEDGMANSVGILKKILISNFFLCVHGKKITV